MEECLKVLLKDTGRSDLFPGVTLSESPIQHAEFAEADNLPSNPDLFSKSGGTDAKIEDSGFFLFGDTNKLSSDYDGSVGEDGQNCACDDSDKMSPDGSVTSSVYRRDPSKDSISQEEPNDIFDILSIKEVRATDPEPTSEDAQIKMQLMETIQNIQNEVSEQQENLTTPLDKFLTELRTTNYEPKLKRLFQTAQTNDGLIQEFKKMNKQNIQMCRQYENETEQMIEQSMESLGLATIGYSRWVCEFSVDLNELDEQIKDLETFAESSDQVVA